MLQIIDKVPVYVWPLFAILLFSGLRARKTGMVPLTLLLLIPAIFFGWSVYSFFSRYISDPIAICLWTICDCAGFMLGFFYAQRLKLSFDKENRKVEMPGSWLPLILSLSIFSAKFASGMMRAMLPHLEGSIGFLALELFSIFIVGIFTGRGVGCLAKYRSTNETLQR